MAIPADILSIERPKNSFVIRTNKTEPPLYAVRSRVGCKYVNGRRLPQNRPVIGHIDTDRLLDISILKQEFLSRFLPSQKLFPITSL